MKNLILLIALSITAISAQAQYVRAKPQKLVDVATRQTKPATFEDTVRLKGALSLGTDTNGVYIADVFTRSNPGSPTKLTAPKIYAKTITTAGGSGLAVDTLTTNGAASGTALFSHIYSVIATPYYNDTVKASIPKVYHYATGSGNKTVTIRAFKGDSIPYGSGLSIRLTVIGD